MCIYHLVIWSNFNLLHSSQWITFLTQLCLPFYSFCVCLLYSFIMQLTVSSLSPRNLLLLFFCVLSISALTQLVSLALFYVAIKRNSVFLSWFSFLCHIQVLSLVISSRCRLKYPYSCSYFHFCNLVFIISLFVLVLPLPLLLIAAAINLSLLFFSCIPRILALIHLRNPQ